MEDFHLQPHLKDDSNAQVLKSGMSCSYFCEGFDFYYDRFYLFVDHKIACCAQPRNRIVNSKRMLRDDFWIQSNESFFPWLTCNFFVLPWWKRLSEPFWNHELQTERNQSLMIRSGSADNGLLRSALRNRELTNLSALSLLTSDETNDDFFPCFLACFVCLTMFWSLRPFIFSFLDFFAILGIYNEY